MLEALLFELQANWEVVAFVAVGILLVVAFAMWHFVWRNRQDPKFLCQAAERARQSGNTRKALVLYERVLSLEQTLPQIRIEPLKETFAAAHLDLGEILTGQREFARAASHFKKARALGAHLQAHAVGVLAEQ